MKDGSSAVLSSAADILSASVASPVQPPPVVFKSPAVLVDKSAKAVVGKSAKTTSPAAGGAGDKSANTSSLDVLYPYLQFDTTLPRDQLAANLAEGVNMPGIGAPIIMRSSKLPEGWRKWAYVRGKGLSMGK